MCQTVNGELKMSDKKSEKSPGALEKNLLELEQIVRELEKGQISLDESLDKYEKGIKLYQDCKKVLDQAQKRVQILSESFKE